jgi:hypothetical protein
LLARKQASHCRRRCRGGTGSFHGGRLNLHLPEVEVEDVEDIQEVEEHPRTSHIPGAPESIAGVELDSITKTLDPTRCRFKPQGMQSRGVLGYDYRVEGCDPIDH